MNPRTIAPTSSYADKGKTLGWNQKFPRAVTATGHYMTVGLPKFDEGQRENRKFGGLMENDHKTASKLIPTDSLFAALHTPALIKIGE